MKNDFSSEISFYSLPLPCAAHEAVRDLWVSRVQVLNSVVNIKLPAILSHWRSTTVSLETYPFTHYSVIRPTDVWDRRIFNREQNLFKQIVLWQLRTSLFRMLPPNMTKANSTYALPCTTRNQNDTKRLKGYENGMVYTHGVLLDCLNGVPMTERHLFLLNPYLVVKITRYT